MRPPTSPSPLVEALSPQGQGCANPTSAVRRGIRRRRVTPAAAAVPARAQERRRRVCALQRADRLARGTRPRLAGGAGAPPQHSGERRSRGSVGAQAPPRRRRRSPASALTTQVMSRARRCSAAATITPPLPLCRRPPPGLRAPRAIPTPRTHPPPPPPFRQSQLACPPVPWASHACAPQPTVGANPLPVAVAVVVLLLPGSICRCGPSLRPPGGPSSTRGCCAARPRCCSWSACRT